ncbi:MAG: type II toxin-antitoxin system RelE/ParE family toxin [Richelia sp. RM2_1_2]|nr:type II toxin-antitoxin system RelE/ParE family toxin [Richelia sp. RM1_1_1]NJO62231.1 type II toxin-antitoxin system RelE/ParE family toxin [Richelia sp. RM2_1_2]
MNYALVFRSEARDELDEAYNWYEIQQPGLGDEFLEYVEKILNRICQQPELYAVVYQDVRRVVLRRFPYVISYRIVSSRIVITGVFHGRRDPKTWLERT